MFLGLTCYVCQSTSSASSCLSNPEDSSTCNSNYCTIYRRELAEPKGIVTAFYRACEDKPLYLNTEVSTPYALTYYRACNSDLCNTGDGTVAVTSVTAIETSGDTIIVPGVGVVNSASTSLHTRSVYYFVLILIASVIRIYYK